MNRMRTARLITPFRIATRNPVCFVTRLQVAGRSAESAISLLTHCISEETTVEPLGVSRLSFAASACSLAGIGEYTNCANPLETLRFSVALTVNPFTGYSPVPIPDSLRCVELRAMG